MSIEKKALDEIIPYLKKIHQTVSKGRIKTFDLSVGGGDVEVKGKGKPFAKLDFMSFTQNQYDAVKNGPNFYTYLVCGLDSGSPEKFRISSEKLRGLTPRVVTSYEFGKGELEKLGADLEPVK
jgi:hypothetical protein